MAYKTAIQLKKRKRGDVCFKTDLSSGLLTAGIDLVGLGFFFCSVSWSYATTTEKKQHLQNNINYCKGVSPSHSFLTGIKLNPGINTVRPSGRICSSFQAISALQQVARGSLAEKHKRGEKKIAYCFEASPHPCLHLHFLGQYLLLEWSSLSIPSNPPLAAVSPVTSGSPLEL